jgi:Zn-dependent protease with chaperone function
MGGNGLVLISQGLLGLLSEPELRAVLARGARRARRPDTPIRSMSSWFALKLLGHAPSQWLSVSYEVAPDRAGPGSLTPRSLFAFLLVLPLIRFFLAMSLLDSIERLTSADSAPSEDLNSALHKVRRAIETWRLTATPVRYPFL